MRRSALWSVLVLASLWATPASGETRRALLVGIDKYEVTGQQAAAAARGTTTDGKIIWTDLDGSVNDVKAMRNVLVGKYGFDAKNVLVLENAAATRERILGEIQRHLADPAQPGDVSFFFYAGHGSQVPNDKSRESDRKDESIVPADSALGALDIRDKELNRALAKVVDRSAILTVVLDSCNSGSGTRGLVYEKTRGIREHNAPVSDPGDDVAPLADRGVLTLSAAQDFEPAWEGTDEKGVKHGAFSLALLRVLMQAPESQSAGRIFALASSDIRRQVPVIEGKSRLDKPFFGVGPANPSGRISVVGLPGPSGQIELKGGHAIGLAPGCELVPSGKEGSPLRVRVTKVTGIDSALAEIIGGTDKDIAAPALLDVAVWTAGREDLRVWISPDALPLEAILRLRPEIEKLKASASVQWVDNPADVLPAVVIGLDAGQWTLFDLQAGRKTPIGKEFSATGILAALAKETRPAPAKLFVRLPPATELAAAMTAKASLDLPDSAVRRAASEESAHYLLLGRQGAGGPEFALVLPFLGGGARSALPTSTAWIPAGTAAAAVDKAAESLRDKAVTLRRVLGWLALTSPDSADRKFPYSLALRNSKSNVLVSMSDALTAATGPDKDGKAVVRTNLGPLIAGERYDLVLIRDKDAAQASSRWVYVSIIDSTGSSVVLYPPSGVENKHPKSSPPPPEITLTSIDVSEPFGMDTYVLLASEAPVSTFALEWEGVKSRGVRGNASPLEQLLYDAAEGTRGARNAPGGWSIEKLPVLSTK